MNIFILLIESSSSINFGGSVIGSSQNVNTGASVNMTSSSDNQWALTNEDKQKFSDYFNRNKDLGDKISIQKAIEMFKASKIPMDNLKKILSLVPFYDPIKLNIKEFSVVMHLVYKYYQNVPIPNTLPSVLQNYLTSKEADIVNVSTSSNINTNIIPNVMNQRTSIEPKSKTTSNNELPIKNVNIPQPTNVFNVSTSSTQHFPGSVDNTPFMKITNESSQINPIPVSRPFNFEPLKTQLSMANDGLNQSFNERKTELVELTTIKDEDAKTLQHLVDENQKIQNNIKSVQNNIKDIRTQINDVQRKIVYERQKVSDGISELNQTNQEYNRTLGIHYDLIF